MRLRTLSVLLIALAALAACGDKPSSPGVPRLSGGTAAAGQNATARKAALHAAGECIRTHGAPTYQDPVLTPDGHVYTDARTIEKLDDNQRQAVEQACGALIQAANFQPDERAPAPPKLVQAGVKAAQCLRAHGLPNVKDPTASTSFTPGHGFGLDGSDLPSGGKGDPTVKSAFDACKAFLDEETKQSSLGNLANG